MATTLLTVTPRNFIGWMHRCFDKHSIERHSTRPCSWHYSIGIYSRMALERKEADPSLIPNCSQHDDVIQWKFFRVTGPLCGEFAGHRRIPLTKGQQYGLWCFFDVGPLKLLNKQYNDRWVETTWRSYDAIVMIMSHIWVNGLGHHWC